MRENETFNEQKELERIKDSTQIFALGGIEEIGKNTYVIEHGDEIFIVDAGLKFPDEKELPGVDKIIPSYDYLKENERKIAGLIITHAHEDHIGGIPFLLKTVKVPKIYGAKLTLGIVQKKLNEHKDIVKPQFVTYDDATEVKTKNFYITFFRVCHSVPDAFGVYFKTKNGTIVTTGDFRFDFSTAGDQTDMHKIAKLSQEGIDVLLIECTNAETPGFSDSEVKIIEEIGRIVRRSIGRVFISTFASNLGRIEEIIEIALKFKRKICVIGKSMDTNIKTSINVGYLNVNTRDFIEARDIEKYKDNEVMVISTGSQGEEMAALNIMAQGKHPWINFKPTDTVILSSNPIPGNWQSVEDLVNRLYHKNITVIQNSPHLKIHASGHATETEQQLMIKLVNPKYIIPIHGEFKMLKRLEKNANYAGVHMDNIIQISNGQKAILKNHVLRASDIFIDADEDYVEGNQINKNFKGVLNTRKNISNNGVFSVILTMDEKHNLLSLPSITTRGCFYAKSEMPLMTKMAYAIKDAVQEEIKNKGYNEIGLKKICSNTVNYYIWKNKKKHPMVRTSIFII